MTRPATVDYAVARASSIWFTRRFGSTIKRSASPGGVPDEPAGVTRYTAERIRP